MTKDPEKNPGATPPAAPPRSRLEKSLKWIGAVTAVLSLVFGLNQLTLLISDVRERQRQIAELSAMAHQQQEAADYEAAWASFEQALKIAESGGRLAKLTGQLGEERVALRTAQEDLAMQWLQNISKSQNQTFSTIVDKLVLALNRGMAHAAGARQADLLAHIGWANFLRWRDGHQNLNPEQQYRQALALDSANPYAHVHWGHWMLWRREKFEEAKAHFTAALAAGRARDYVRRVQLAALKNLGSEGEGELLAAINDMRKNNEGIDASARHDLYAIYSFACGLRYDAGRFADLLAAVPASEQLDTFQALFYGQDEPDFDQWKRPGREACLATLLEMAGRPEEALQTWIALSQRFPPEDNSSLANRSRAAVQRLSPNR